MKERKFSFENRLKRAVEAATPDVLPSILARIENMDLKEISADEKSEAERTERDGKVMSISEEKKRRNNRRLKGVISFAAAFIIVFAFWLVHINFYPQSQVVLDVNPSINLTISQKERVIKVNAANSDAETVIGDMKLKGVDLDIAINALIGSMVKNGYISELNNSILITVSSNDAEAGKRLKEHLSEDINLLLQGLSVDASIMSQNSSGNSHLKALAKEYDISAGKAALIESLVNADPDISFSDAANLSINDIRLLVESRQSELSQLDVSGEASERAYIGIERALEIAFSDGSIDPATVTELEVEYSFKIGRMVYEIEFKVGSYEYNYDIDAATGDIMKYATEPGKDKTAAVPGSDKVALTAGDIKKTTFTDTGKAKTIKKATLSIPEMITADSAESIALKHAGFNKSQVRELEVELEREDSRLIYELEFKVGNYEYEYEIDAYSGNILEYNKEIDD